MPYIDRKKRDELDLTIAELGGKIENEGELNYTFFTLALKLLNKKGMSYETLNTIEGVFGCCSKEFYRRVTLEYEKQKIRENGDINFDQHVQDL